MPDEGGGAGRRPFSSSDDGSDTQRQLAVRALWRNVRVLRDDVPGGLPRRRRRASCSSCSTTSSTTSSGSASRRASTTCDQPAGFAIPDTDFRSSQSLLDALLVGVQNTIKVALLGIVLATILGVIVGVARLSIELARAPGRGALRRDVPEHPGARDHPLLVPRRDDPPAADPGRRRAPRHVRDLEPRHRGPVVRPGRRRPGVRRSSPSSRSRAAVAVWTLADTALRAHGQPHRRVLWAGGRAPPHPRDRLRPRRPPVDASTRRRWASSRRAAASGSRRSTPRS